ncbi:MAG: Type IV secretory pathway VirB4 component-like protein [Candidatus Moranbacteria bacterium GW2011_GWC1_45_18]|nr:MAG: Type IV secretory pathway VirB4 component-like protein [Candidatus Moranbacteria bacterium GW2011_GWC2_40_12]KKT32603.1 MAG: Type IV secretory pathway VirB4 component-like protein [Candidatus Moranbacteria bacterium GW2011_GWF2_44_10]KKU00761.1 MAG: Type IV secretory pathway VirB4 component-like protein [Candidatus Moranbacteria bacterium GW2011_GWC1_45_18]OGI41353.1 MAG: conjugal transfer protein TraC [Candidatus Moranbacteria bacterium RIFOXYD1_FULL_44_9]HBB37311.1 conjugal transfer p
MLDFLKNIKEEKKKPAELFVEGSDVEKIFREGLATITDLIAPSALDIGSNFIQVGETFAKTIFVTTYPRFLHTAWFSPIINLDIPMDISMSIYPVESVTVMKSLRRRITQVESEIHLEAEAGKVRDPALETALQDIEQLRDQLQQGTERFFRFGLYITIYGKSKLEAEKSAQFIESLLESRLTYVKEAVFRSEQGFSSTLPLANDELNVSNNMNSQPLSTTFPFVSSDLSSSSGILYGINRHNNSLVLFDRFEMENANMVIFAKSGAGKSYAVKLEILRSLMFGTDVIVIDPENEYQFLCEAIGGSFINISLTSNYHLNPFDLPDIGENEDLNDILRSNIASLLGLLHIMLGNITPEEDSILDRAISETYAIKDITLESKLRIFPKEQIPTMSDLYDVLRNMEGGEDLATRLEKYTQGIFSGFLNNQSNVSLDNQMVVFNIRDMEEELRPVAMYVVLDFIWNEIRSKLKKRMIVVDEAWVMMQHEDAGSFMFSIAKRCRKYFAGLTTITQDISDFLASRYGKPIVTNSSIQLLLKQSPAAIDVIGDTFYLTDQEKFMLLECGVGEGIFFAGTKHVAIQIVASYSEDQLVTTNPEQILRRKEEAVEKAE